MTHLETVANAIKETPLFGWDNGIADKTQPISCNISLANICNHSCFMCGHQNAMRKERGIMSKETLDNILSSLPDSVKLNCCINAFSF